MLGFCWRLIKSTTLFPHHRENVGNYRDIVDFPYYGDSEVKPNCWDGTFLLSYQRLGKCGLSLYLPTLSLCFPYYQEGTFFSCVTPCRCIGYSCDRQDARNFKSIVFKCVIIFLHVGGIAVSCYKVVHARNSWNDHGHPVCTGSDPTTDPTNPIFPTDPTIDPTDSTIYCCDPAVMHLMLSLVIINCILGCYSYCWSGIVSLMSFN